MDDREHAKNQARAQLDSIKEMVEEMRAAEESDNEDRREEAMDRIQEDPLSVEVRSDWHIPGAEDRLDAEYRILLCTGGPAVQIIGDLNEYGEPETARIEYQDWGTPWTVFPLDNNDESIVLDYCRCFYFGE